MKIGNYGESSAEQGCRLRKRLWCARTIENPEQKLLTRPASLEIYGGQDNVFCFAGVEKETQDPGSRTRYLRHPALDYSGLMRGT